MERLGAVTIKGQPFTLIGKPLSVGDRAPEAELTANDFSTVKLSDYAGKTQLISVVFSLDTSICDMQTRKFNEEAGQFTWFDYRAGAFRKNQGMRIDHVYATAPIYEHCVEVVHDATPRSWESPSDHIPVLAKFT